MECCQGESDGVFADDDGAGGCICRGLFGDVLGGWGGGWEGGGGRAADESGVGGWGGSGKEIVSQRDDM